MPCHKIANINQYPVNLQSRDYTKCYFNPSVFLTTSTRLSNGEYREVAYSEISTDEPYYVVAVVENTSDNDLDVTVKFMTKDGMVIGEVPETSSTTGSATVAKNSTLQMISRDRFHFDTAKHDCLRALITGWRIAGDGDADIETGNSRMRVGNPLFAQYNIDVITLSASNRTARVEFTMDAEEEEVVVEEENAPDANARRAAPKAKFKLRLENAPVPVEIQPGSAARGRARVKQKVKNFVLNIEAPDDAESGTKTTYEVTNKDGSEGFTLEVRFE